MANKPAAPIFRGQGNNFFRVDDGNRKIARGQDVPYGVNGAPPSGGGGGSVAWGAISGTLSAQADLQGVLDLKLESGDLALVAFSGAYADLTGKPVLATVATTGAYSDLAGLPALATVATSGSASDLSTGTLPAGRFPALTGDVTSIAGALATTIANGAVNLAKMANVATATVFYRKTAGAGAPEVQTLATLKADLGLTGTNSGDQTITLTGDVTGSGTGSFAATIGAGAVSLAKMANLAANSMIGNNTGAGATPIALTKAQAKALLAIAAADVSGLAPVATSGSAGDLSTGTLPQARVTDYQCGNMEFHLKITGLFLNTQQITNVTAVASAADRYQVHPWTPSRDVVIQNIGVEVTTLLAGSNAKVVVHDTDPTTGGPNNVLFETANLSCAAVGYVSETRSFTFQKGVTYWVGVRTSSTQSLRAYTQTAARNIGQALGTGLPQNALQKTLAFATAAPAWGVVTTGQFVGGNPLAVIMQLA